MASMAPTSGPSIPNIPNKVPAEGAELRTVAREALPLQTIGKLVGPRLKTIAGARCLVLMAEFLR